MGIKIEFTRTGGFTGLPLHIIIDLDQLPESESAELKRLYALAGLSELCTFDNSSTRDGFSYSISVREGEKTASFELSDRDLTENSLNFIQALLSRARTAGK